MSWNVPGILHSTRVVNREIGGTKLLGITPIVLKVSIHDECADIEGYIDLYVHSLSYSVLFCLFPIDLSEGITALNYWSKHPLLKAWMGH